MKAAHPGDTLRWLMLEDGILADEVAERTTLPLAQIRAIIEGALPITPEIASKLEKLGGWLWMKTLLDHCRWLITVLPGPAKR